MPLDAGLHYRGGVETPTSQQSTDQRLAVAASPQFVGTDYELHKVIDWASGPKLAEVATWTSSLLDLGARDLTTTGYLALGSSPATDGIIRLESNFEVQSRNGANNQNLRILYAANNDIVYLGDVSNVWRTFIMAVDSINFTTYQSGGGTRTVGVWEEDELLINCGDSAISYVGKRTASGPTYTAYVSTDELHINAVADASAAGNITHRVEVFDRAGASLGYAYLYDS